MASTHARHTVRTLCVGRSISAITHNPSSVRREFSTNDSDRGAAPPYSILQDLLRKRIFRQCIRAHMAAA